MALRLLFSVMNRVLDIYRYLSQQCNYQDGEKCRWSSRNAIKWQTNNGSVRDTKNAFAYLTPIVSGNWNSSDGYLFFYREKIKKEKWEKNPTNRRVCVHFHIVTVNIHCIMQSWELPGSSWQSRARSNCTSNFASRSVRKSRSFAGVQGRGAWQRPVIV